MLAIGNEIGILEKVDHPNILRLIKHYDEDDKVFLVTELCEGGDLFNRISERDYFTESDAQHVVRAIASALQLLHAKKVVHRDLKPENILLLNKEENSPLRVADFGFARIVGEDLLKTRLGSPNYMAPEILRKEPYDFKVDVWSLGVIMYILLCGYPPFAGDGMPEMFEMIKEGKFEFHPEYWENVSSEAKDLIANMLVLDASKRFTIEQCLAHPFMSMDHSVNERDITPVVSELKGLLAKSGRLKSVARAVLAANRLKSLIAKKE